MLQNLTWTMACSLILCCTALSAPVEKSCVCCSKLNLCDSSQTWKEKSSVLLGKLWEGTQGLAVLQKLVECCLSLASGFSH